MVIARSNNCLKQTFIVYLEIIKIVLFMLVTRKKKLAVSNEVSQSLGFFGIL